MAEAFALDELFGAAAPVSTVTDSPGGSLATEKPKHWCPYCGTTSDSEEEAGIRHTMCENIANRMASENLALYIRAVKGCSRKEWLPLNVLKTDMHPGDGAAIMAAIHLIKLGATPYVGLAINIKSEDLAFLRRNGTKRLVQAAALLEFAHANSPANPQILLLLIRLYSYLGAGSLAMRSFKRLNLKRIQLDTLGYMLFDRLSTLHPHSWNDKTYSDSSEVFNHRIMLEKVHFEYKRFQDETQKNLMRSFDNGSYYSVFQLESASQNISHSLGAVLSVVELRSNHRMIKPTTPFSRYNYGYEILRK